MISPDTPHFNSNALLDFIEYQDGGPEEVAPDILDGDQYGLFEEPEHKVTIQSDLLGAGVVQAARTEQPIHGGYTIEGAKEDMEPWAVPLYPGNKRVIALKRVYDYYESLMRKDSVAESRKKPDVPFDDYYGDEAGRVELSIAERTAKMQEKFYEALDFLIGGESLRDRGVPEDMIKLQFTNLKRDMNLTFRTAQNKDANKNRKALYSTYIKPYETKK